MNFTSNTQSINCQINFYLKELLFLLQPPSTYRTTEKHNLLSVNPKTKWEEISHFPLMWKYFHSFSSSLCYEYIWKMDVKKQQRWMRFWAYSRRSLADETWGELCAVMICSSQTRKTPFGLPVFRTLGKPVEGKLRERKENSRATREWACPVPVVEDNNTGECFVEICCFCLESLTMGELQDPSGDFSSCKNFD